MKREVCRACQERLMKEGLPTLSEFKEEWEKKNWVTCPRDATPFTFKLHPRLGPLKGTMDEMEPEDAGWCPCKEDHKVA